MGGGPALNASINALSLNSFVIPSRRTGPAPGAGAGRTAISNLTNTNFSSSSSSSSTSSISESSKTFEDDQWDNPHFPASVLPPVPSPAEVQNAIASLMSFLDVISSNGMNSGCVHPVLNHLDAILLPSPGFQRVIQALNQLKTEPAVQKMVVSISSDKALWDAVLQNKLVRQLSQPLGGVHAEELSPDDGNDPDIFSVILRLSLDIIKAKIIQLVETFKSLVDDMFDASQEKEGSSVESKGHLDDKLKSSVLLSIIILLIVVVTRASRT